MPIIDAWLDLVHGGTCAGCGCPGRVLCRVCAASLPQHARPARPTPCPEGLARCFAGGEYAGLLGRLVVAHKERGAHSLAGVLGGVLAIGVDRALPPTSYDAPVVLVPVPSRPATVRARGHDPVLRMTAAAARRLRVRGTAAHVVRLLEQHGAVRDQAGLGHAQRAENLAHSMRTRPRDLARLARVGPVRVVVCDDVLTTGATAREAQRALEDVGVVVGAVVTVAATRRRRTGHLPSQALPI